MSQSEQLKRHLCQHLKLVIKMNGWSQRKAAGKLCSSQSVISDMVSNDGSKASLSTVIDCLDRAWMDIKITITPR